MGNGTTRVRRSREFVFQFVHISINIDKFRQQNRNQCRRWAYGVHVEV